MILPVLQEDMKVTTVQRAPRTCHDTESNFAEVWKSPTLRNTKGEEWGGSDAAIFRRQFWWWSVIGLRFRRTAESFLG